MVAIRIGIVVYFLVCISFPIDSAAENLDDQYIGCYKDNDTVRDLGNLISSDSMTISFCIDYCQNNNKTYAGIQNGNTCFCGDTYGTYGPSKNCNISCLGDTSYYCGGHLQNSIYAVCPFGRYWTSCNRECHCAKETPCYLSNGTCPSDCAAGWNGTQCNGTAVPASSLSYHGCYTDARTNGFPLLFRNTTHLSIQLCMDRCRIYFGLYIGLQYGQECYCGNSSYSNYGTSDKCGMDCPPQPPQCNCSGSPSDRCGGTYANDVYSACQSGYYGVLCSHQCHCLDGANCTMENGTCPQGACAAGWTGMSCNIRNCLDNNGDCTGENEICTDEKTGEGAERVVPRCRCKEGYSRHREYEPCKDLNECELKQPENECDPSIGKCFNLVGSYNCTCFEGFTNSGSSKACKDVNECELTLPENECDPTIGQCFNHVGGYNCTCLEGYTNNGSSKACKDLNECELTQPENECDPSIGKCFNLVGSYSCTCLEGFTNNGNPKACKGNTSSSAWQTVAIAMSVLFGVSLAVNITILITWLCNTLRARKDPLTKPENVLPTEMTDLSNVSSAPSTYEELRRPDESQLHQNNYEKLTETTNNPENRIRYHP